jgi:hypothetical protein
MDNMGRPVLPVEDSEAKTICTGEPAQETEREARKASDYHMYLQKVAAGMRPVYISINGTK